MHKKHALNERGIAHVAVLLVVVVVAVVGFAGYRVMKQSSDAKQKQGPSASNTSKQSTATASAWPMDTGITWTATGQGGWIPIPYDVKVPDCPSPVQLRAPTTDLDKVTSILYPGQTRTGTFAGKGGNYKPHGGFRFDKATDNNMTAIMPFDGYVMRGVRFLVEGEIQYGFDIVNPCGIMVRLGHLRELTPEFQAIADKFPAPIEGDSHTTKVEPMPAFKTGQKIATAVGFKATKNVGFDFGVYDLRTNNEAAKDPAYQKTHADTAELSWHALCWLDMLGSKDSATVKALPGGEQKDGKRSDYCK